MSSLPNAPASESFFNKNFSNNLSATIEDFLLMERFKILVVMHNKKRRDFELALELFIDKHFTASSFQHLLLHLK
jgi:hypothetical protein